MPELPEVETVVRTLRPRMLGGIVQRVRLGRTDILTPSGCDLCACLEYRTITGIARRGKRIVFTLDNGHRFYIHLGMTGRLTIESASSPIESHTHLILEVVTPGDRETIHLRFRDPRRFGGVWWLGDDDSHDQAMGPEPLTLRAKQLSKLLQKD